MSGGPCLPFSRWHPTVRSSLAAPHVSRPPLQLCPFPGGHWQPFPTRLCPSGLPTLLQRASCGGAERAEISLLFNWEGAMDVPAAAFATQPGARSIHTAGAQLSESEAEPLGFLACLLLALVRQEQSRPKIPLWTGAGLDGRAFPQSFWLGSSEMCAGSQKCCRVLLGTWMWGARTLSQCLV